MARNVEIKAAVREPAELARRAAELGTPAQRLIQTDVYFRVPRGRLKLRVFGEGSVSDLAE